MSSIYRKGRDGYFYYQTYVKNPETGKKDKKLFHSLGTKNEHEAKEKQKYFDLKYESKEAKIKKNFYMANKKFEGYYFSLWYINPYTSN